MKPRPLFKALLQIVTGATMRSLPVPDVTASEALRLCASSIKDADLARRLQKVEGAVALAEGIYRERGAEGQLHAIAKAAIVGDSVTGKEMERVYNGTFVKSVKTKRIYAGLKKVCVNDICPLCGQGTVRQLDHYLPITGYPVFGVTAANLVPACSDCNKNKLAHIPASASEQTIHPYFDSFGDERWLYGEVVESEPAAVRFMVKPPDSWGEVDCGRVSTHFRIYKLGALYATHAGVEISNMRHYLKKLSSVDEGGARVRGYLAERAESCAFVHENSWQRVTFEALHASDWFCAGGFEKT